MILVMHNLRKRKNKGLRTFVTSLMLTAFCMPSPATAVTLGQLKGNSGFRTMVVAISNLNVAMQQATINPHDKIRRENVAKAYSMMPLAITALAKEFKNNKLHDQDFQFVQGILGGFVQKDLSSKVEEFMKNPSNQNIPSVGQGFPQESLKEAENSYIVASQEKSLLATENEDGTLRDVKSKASSDLVDLNTKFNPAQSASSIQDSKATPEANSTIVADSNKSLLNSPDTEIKDDKKSLDSNIAASKVDEAQVQELSSPAAVRKPASQNDEEEALDNGFFKDKKKADKEAKEKKIRKGASQKLKSGFLFNSKRKQLVSYVWESLFPLAAAAGPAPAPDCQGGGKECGGGGGGGGGAGGGGGGGSGGGAAEILFGLAAIMAAASPMVAAAIQANADQQIAQINSNTAITNANTQASLQRYSIDQQTGLAKFQAEATQQIAQEKNQKEMTQLQMQLSDLAQAREQQYTMQQQKMASEQANQLQELNLKEQQAAQTIQLAQQQRMAQEVAQGLSTGLQTVRDANGRLAVSNVPLTGGVGLGANGSLASGSLNQAGRNSSMGLNAPTGGATASANTNSVAQANAAAASSLGSAFTAPNTAVTSNTVLTANKNSSPNTGTAKALLAAAIQPISPSANIMTSRGLASVNGTVKAPQRGFAAIAQGSSRRAKQVLPKVVASSIENNKTDLAYIKNNLPETETTALPSDSAHTSARDVRAVFYNSRRVRAGSTGYGY